MKKYITSVLEVASAVSVTVGAALVSSAAGFVTAGVFGLLFAREVAR